MMANKLLRRIATAVAVLGGLAAMAAIFAHWRLDQPSAAERRLEQVTAERPRVADAGNAYIYLWGFDAPADTDPARAGALRLAWLADFNLGLSTAPDPLAKGLEFAELAGPGVGEIAAACGRNAGEKCRDLFDALRASPQWSDMDTLLLARYERLLRHSGSFATARLEIHSPMPPWTDVLFGQRCYFLRLLDTARAADAPAVRARLRADLAFWRMAQQSAEDLISKMIALAAIRQHFFLGNLVLRRLPAAGQRIALPEIWEQPVTTAERSMWRAFAGELEFSKSLLRDTSSTADAPLVFDEGVSFADEMLERVGGRIFPPGMQLRSVARGYAELATAFEAPLDEYLEVEQRLRKRGKGIARAALAYPLRVGSVEILRRAALLTATLRAAGVPAADVAARVASSELRDPLTLAPFKWHAVARAVVAESAVATNGRPVFFFY